MNTLKHTWMRAAYLCAAIIGFATASANSNDTTALEEHKGAEPRPVEHRPIEHQVDIKGFLYNPDPIKVKLGDTIAWTNHDIVPHTATITKTDVGTGEILFSDSASMQMQERGSLAYHCRYHANMRGVIEVE